MSDDRFEDRLRALAQQLSESLSDIDLGDVADRLGVDADRVREAADAAQDWLHDRVVGAEPLFGGGTAPRPEAYGPAAAQGDSGGPGGSVGPHPLDAPTDAQGRALSALDSGRWTLRPGASRFEAAPPTVGPLPLSDADLAGDLRARDWIAADGTVTLVGREALRRWTAATGGDDPAPAA